MRGVVVVGYLCTACKFVPPAGTSSDGPEPPRDGDMTDDQGSTVSACTAKWRSGAVALTTPTRLTTNTAYDGDPSLSADGLTLYLSSNSGTVGLDIFKMTRSTITDMFSGAPVRVAELSEDAPSEDTKITFSGDNLLAIISSTRVIALDYELYASVRTTTSEPFNFTRDLLLAFDDTVDQFDPELNRTGSRLYWSSHQVGTNQSLLVSNRGAAGYEAPTFLLAGDNLDSDADPTLSSDEMVLVFTRGTALNERQLFYATRNAVTEQFANPTEVPTVNQSDFDGDPELSPDGCELYFSTRRNGANNREIYRSTVIQ